MGFTLKTEKNGLRSGLIKTTSGSLVTPFFMPDATRGFLKLLTNEEALNCGTKAMVVNTFHLYLQPGTEIIKKAGGIHKFMSWPGLLLSDSGGYQVFSLIHRNKKMGKIYDDHVRFKSPLDGSWHELSPEKSINIQFDLGVDMMVVLDDCPPNDFETDKLKASVKRTIAWAKRSKKEYEKQLKKRRIPKNKRPLLFGVIQGGADLKLREYCAKELVKIGFDGYGFGARPVDKDGNFLDEVLRQTAAFIPKKAIRFALGIGTPEDIVRSACMGWDIFDCVIPTREGRHGRLFSFNKKNNLKLKSLYKTLNIKNAAFGRDFSDLKKNSRLKSLKNCSYAYLHHLFKLDDPLAQRLASLNNLEFYNELLALIRAGKIKI